MAKLTLSVLPDLLGVVRLDAQAELPTWVSWQGNLVSLTKTDEELSVVCREEDIPGKVTSEKGWRAFKVEGPLDFSLVGILSSLSQPLAEAKISIFAISTYDTDYILVKEGELQKAIEVLGSFCQIQQ